MNKQNKPETDPQTQRQADGGQRGGLGMGFFKCKITTNV